MWNVGFRGAGVPPAIFILVSRSKTAGETPAPPNLANES